MADQLDLSGFEKSREDLSGFDVKPTEDLSGFEKGFFPSPEVSPITIQDLAEKERIKTESQKPFSEEIPQFEPKLPTSEEIKKLTEQQGAIDKTLNELGNIPMSIGGAVGGTLLLPAHFLSGQIERTGEAISNYKRTGTIKDALEGYASPGLLKKLRQTPLSDVDGFDEESTFGKILQAKREIFPDIAISESLQSQIPQAITAPAIALEVLTGNPETAALLRGEKEPSKWAIAATKLGYDIGLDPTIYSKFFAAIPQELMSSAKASEALAAKPLSTLVKEAEQRAMSSVEGLGPDIAAGKKAAFQFKLPFMKPWIVKGQSIGEMLDKVGSTLERMTNVRPLMQRSGLTRFDNMMAVDNLKQAEQIDALQKVHGEALSANAQSEKVTRIAKNIAEHGQIPGLALSKQQGLSHSPEEVEQALSLLRVWDDATKAGNDALYESSRRVFGEKAVNLSAIEHTTRSKAEAEKVINELTKNMGEIPRIVVSDDAGNLIDLTLSGSSGRYDTGRALKEEAHKAIQLQDTVNEWSQKTRSSGFAAKTSAEKERVPLSTAAYNAYLKNKYGINEAFNPDATHVVLDKFTEKMTRARQLDMLAFTKANYGITHAEMKAWEAGEVPRVILDARTRIESARIAAIPPSIEDLRMASMTPNDFRQMGDRVWNKVSPFVKDDTVFLREQGTYYPRQVADRVEAYFGRPDPVKVGAVMNFINSQWAKSTLTSPFRLGPQVVDNMTRLMALGVSPEDIMKETMYSIYGGGDEINKLARNLPAVSETVFDLTDYAKDIKVSAKMITDPEVNAAVDHFYESIAGTLAGSGSKLERAMKRNGVDILSKAAQSPADLIRLVNENPFSEAMRSFANSADLISKRAYFRNLIRQGVPVEEAVKRVGDHLMDFGSTTDLVAKGRYFLPFASFQAKNIETMFPLLAMRPGVYNIVNPYEGHLKRSLEEMTGNDVRVSAELRKKMPIYRNEILLYTLKGADKLTAEEAQDPIRKMLEQYVSWGLGPSQKDVLAQGLQLSLRLPTQFEAAGSLFDSKTPMTRRFGSPLMAAIAIGQFGVDPFSGNPIDTVEGSQIEWTDKLSTMLRTVNPVSYPKVMQLAQTYVLDPLLPQLRKRMEEGPFSREVAKIIKLQTNIDTQNEKLKLDKSTINTLTSMKFMGLGALDSADTTYYFQQKSLMRVLGELANKLKRTARDKGMPEALRIKAAMEAIVRDIKRNTKIYSDYKTKAGTLNLFMKSPEAQDYKEEMKKVLGSGETTLVPEEDINDAGGASNLPQ